MAHVLLVDQHDDERAGLAEQLSARKIKTLEVGSGEEALRLVRSRNDIDVVVLDRKLPAMTGEQLLKELKSFRPELQVILLTAHGSYRSAMEIGRLDAFSYLEKPCDIDDLVRVIGSAREDKVHAHARHEIPHGFSGSVLRWLIGSNGSRPGVVILGILLLTALLLMPPPERLISLLTAPKTGEMTDESYGYASYRKMETGENITSYYSRTHAMGERTVGPAGAQTYTPVAPERMAFKAQVMLGILAVAALFWATGAVPVGVTALLVGVLMYFLGVMKPDAIAQAYAKDAVVFIFGVLALAAAISKTGLDRRIGLLLLGPARSLPRLLFIFLPLLAVVCSFISEHAMIAFIMPLFMMIYVSSVTSLGIRRDKALAVMFVLSICFAANIGGPGSPAAGGRNAIMLGILSDYGSVPTFGEWVLYGLPFVPVMGLVVAGYFFVMFRRKVQVRKLDVSQIVRSSAEKIGPMHRDEYIVAIALVTLVILWITLSSQFGMGGPVILCLVILNILRVVRWKDMAAIPWDVVALYASACALGKGLADTGAALYLADSFIALLPEFMRSGEGLAIACSIFTGVTTNFMSDGATVSAIGPITVPMASISGTAPWMVGFATAFASSFAHMLIIGTPNNAIAYALAKDPLTGEQLVTLGDFFKHGLAVLLLSFVVLWVWAFFGYWRWIGF
ncbi:response regulator [candidate division GN15 bacterium]|nr:response regulator [candidate division GN15 bacterium]